MLDDYQLLHLTARALRRERERVLRQRERELGRLLAEVREMRAEYLRALETEEEAAKLLAGLPRRREAA